MTSTSAVLFLSSGGRPGGVWLETGPRRRFPATKEGNAAVGFPRIRNPDLHHDLCHPVYVSPLDDLHFNYGISYTTLLWDLSLTIVLNIVKKGIEG